MATNIIYKGELNGTQVDFNTGSLTDISTFTGDVRAAAIANSITNGVTDIGASQDAIIAMSGYLSANAHPSVTEAADVSINNSNGNVIQDVTLSVDDNGHVTTATFGSTNLDSRYYTESEVDSTVLTITGDIASNTSSISTNAGNISTNTSNISTNTSNISTNASNISTNTSDISTLETATGNLNGRIASNDNELITLRTATGFLENEIDALQAVSGVVDLDGVTDAGATTTNDITIGDIRVGGGNITGPSTITIDPDSAGPAGLVVIAGDLQVDGTTTTINSTNVQIDDLSLVLGTGAPNNASADGGGIIIDGAGSDNIAEFTYDGTNDRWKTNGIDIAADIVGSLAGNASTASKWSAATTLSLAGDLGGSVVFDGSDTTETLTATIGAGVVESGMLAGSIPNSKLLNSSVSYGGVSLDLGQSDGTPAFNLSDATNYPTSSLVGTITNTQLDGSIANDKLVNSSVTVSAGNGLSGGGAVALGSSTSLTTASDQGHLDEIELGTDNNSEADATTKGGIMILRGSGSNGISKSGANGNAIDLNSGATVAFEGVVQSVRTDQDSDNGSYVAMWKIQGVIRRDSDSTNMLSSFVTKTFAGSNAGAYSLSVSVSGNGLKINTDQSSADVYTSATINYNCIES
ncbi:hypothetical protein N9973_00510 [bacterium]|nr:hypothetical protein [bacterium]